MDDWNQIWIVHPNPYPRSAKGPSHIYVSRQSTNTRNEVGTTRKFLYRAVHSSDFSDSVEVTIFC